MVQLSHAHSNWNHIFMAEILLPLNAKYYCLKYNTGFNPLHDVIWSFMYSVSNTQVAQHGFSTFITAYSGSTWPGLSAGHYICTNPRSNINLISIAFDTTGLYGLSSTTRPGCLIGDVKPNSLCIRNYNQDVLYYETLTDYAWDTEINVIRCRYSNSEMKLYVDHRSLSSTSFNNLATVDLTLNLPYGSSDPLFSGVSYCSPLSTSLSALASMTIYNFHTEGVRGGSSVETIIADPVY